MDLLYRNLSTLITLEPSLSNPLLERSIYKNLFHVPDQFAFHQIVHFLLNSICPKKCKGSYSWPVDRGTDKGSEKKFLSAVRSIILEIREEYPQYGIPTFTTSFLLNPSGPRFTCLMVKLSAIALRVRIRTPGVAELSAESSPISNSCPDIQVIVFKLEEKYQKQVLHKTDGYIKNLVLQSEKHARAACDKMKEISSKMKEKETELTNWLSNNLIIQEEIKLALIDTKNQQVMEDLITELENKRQSTEKICKKLNELNCRENTASNTIKPVLALRKAHLCLDGSRLQFDVPLASLETLVPTLENWPTPLQSGDGTIILNSVICISNGCLKVLMDKMGRKEMLNNLRLYPHAAIKEGSLRLSQLSAAGKRTVTTLHCLTTTSNQLVSSTVDDYIISETDEEWIKPYRLEDLVPPDVFVTNQKSVLHELNGTVNATSGSMLIESTDHDELINEILACKPELTPPKQFFSTSPVKNWTSQPQKSETVTVPITTVKKTAPKASRLPVSCSSLRKYTSSVVVRSRLQYSCKKVDNVIEEEFSARDINILPTPTVNGKSNGKVHSSPEYSPLATELPKTPEPTSFCDVGSVINDSNAPDILKHTFKSHHKEDLLVTPISGSFVKVVTYMDGEFNETNDFEVSNVGDLLSSVELSPTGSVIDICNESFSCLTSTPSACSTVDLENSGIKKNDCSVSFASNVSKIDHSSTPVEKKKDKTPSTLERIIARYKKVMSSKK